VPVEGGVPQTPLDASRHESGPRGIEVRQGGPAVGPQQRGEVEVVIARPPRTPSRVRPGSAPPSSGGPRPPAVEAKVYHWAWRGVVEPAWSRFGSFMSRTPSWTRTCTAKTARRTRLPKRRGSEQGAYGRRGRKGPHRKRAICHGGDFSASCPSAQQSLHQGPRLPAPGCARAPEAPGTGVLNQARTAVAAVASSASPKQPATPGEEGALFRFQPTSARGRPPSPRGPGTAWPAVSPPLDVRIAPQRR